MYGEDFDPHLYRLLGQSADHVHWDPGDSWKEVSKTLSSATDRAGGGHAHAGLMVYLGDNWPDRYRDSVFAINLHGRRVNHDILDRRGSGFVGRHAPDFLRSSDPWFRAIELLYGPDGGVYIADWSDIGECHENDAVHRDSGRIYKVGHGRLTQPSIADVATLSDAGLVELQRHRNDWYVRQARRTLQERAASGRPMDQVHASLRTMFDHEAETSRKLRALWALHVTGGVDEDWLQDQIDRPEESVRAWAVRLLTDRVAPSDVATRLFATKATTEPSGLVLLYLASSLRTMPIDARWPLAEALSARSEFATDRTLPLMVWYGIEPAVTRSPGRAVALAGSSELPDLSLLIARRLTEDLDRSPEPIAGLVERIQGSEQADRQRRLLAGMAEALRGRRRTALPAGWESTRQKLAASGDMEVRRLARELSAVFGDGRALAELGTLAATKSADPIARRDAIRSLVESRAEGLSTLLRRLVDERDVGSDAIRGLAACGDAETPAFLLEQYPRLRSSSRHETIAALAARPAYARRCSRPSSGAPSTALRSPPSTSARCAAIPTPRSIDGSKPSGLRPTRPPRRCSSGSTGSRPGSLPKTLRRPIPAGAGACLSGPARPATAFSVRERPSVPS